MKKEKKNVLYAAFFRWFTLFFFLLFFFALLISYALSPNEWFLRVIQARFMYFPLLFYLLIFAVVFAVLVALGRIQVEKRILDSLEVDVKKLAEGRYTVSSVKEEASSGILLTQKKEAVQKSIVDIQSKLIELSKQSMKESQASVFATGLTEEDVLKQERHRIARELHDSVSQQLFAAMMLLSAINQQTEQIPDTILKQLLMIQKILNEAQSEMRALLLHLRPINLEGKSLKQGIEHLLKELSTKISSTIKWEIDEVQLQPQVEDHLFRIVQELLSNVLRHAKADELELYMKVNDQALSVKIIDDGIGFDMGQKKTGSYGLTNVRERIQGLGGTMKVISFPDQGTKVELMLPVL